MMTFLQWMMEKREKSEKQHTQESLILLSSSLAECLTHEANWDVSAGGRRERRETGFESKNKLFQIILSAL